MSSKRPDAASPPGKKQAITPRQPPGSGGLTTTAASLTLLPRLPSPPAAAHQFEERESAAANESSEDSSSGEQEGSEDESGEGSSGDEKDRSSEGRGGGPLVSFVGRRRGQRGGSGKATGREQRWALRTYDVFVQIFFNRRGSYYCTGDKHLQNRSFTAKEMTEGLQLYYALLRRERGAGEFDGSMSAEELTDWWLYPLSVCNAYVDSNSASSSSGTSSNDKWKEGWKPFLNGFFYVPDTGRKRRHHKFFQSLATYAPLIVSTYLRVAPSPALTDLAGADSETHTLVLGVLALKDLHLSDVNSVKAMKAIKGDLVHISEDEYKALCLARADHSILESKYGERARLKEPETEERRKKNRAARARSRAKLVATAAAPPRRSSRIREQSAASQGVEAEVKVEMEEGAAAAVRASTLSTMPSVPLATAFPASSLAASPASPVPPTILAPSDDELSAVRRKRGRPRKSSQVLEYRVVVGGMSFVNQACERHFNMEPHDDDVNDWAYRHQWRVATLTKNVGKGGELVHMYSRDGPREDDQVLCIVRNCVRGGTGWRGRG
jgi:hypothetical protein